MTDPRARVPHVQKVYDETRETVLERGIVVDQELKELCFRYLEEDEDVLAHHDDPERYSERERAALAWTHAIAWNSDDADDALWSRLHAAFTEPELVELGYTVAFKLGQLHFEQTGV